MLHGLSHLAAFLALLNKLVYPHVGDFITSVDYRVEIAFRRCPPGSRRKDICYTSGMIGMGQSPFLEFTILFILYFHFVERGLLIRFTPTPTRARMGATRI